MDMLVCVLGKSLIKQKRKDISHSLCDDKDTGQIKLIKLVQCNKKLIKKKT